MSYSDRTHALRAVSRSAVTSTHLLGLIQVKGVVYSELYLEPPRGELLQHPTRVPPCPIQSPTL